MSAPNMADRPIIFSAPMVRALLDGRKTMTRRIIKPQPVPADGTIANIQTAPFAPGDRLWVREAFGLGVSDHGDCPRYKATMDYMCGDKIKSEHEGPFKWKSPIHMPRWASRLTLTVTAVKVERLNDISEDDAKAEGIFFKGPTADDLAWFRSWQEEHGGDPDEPMDGVWTSGIEDTWGPTPESAFMMLWRKIHGPGSWGENPWVAAISFTVEQRNIGNG